MKRNKISPEKRIEATLDELFSLHQFGIKLGLENMTRLLDHIGNPQNNLKTFHIAGSNGKGSTASFIASILTEDGNKVGLYTSPHFVKFNERIRINGVMIEDEYVADFVEGLHDFIRENRPTFFELTTALAFKYFSDRKVDYAVIETGLGGRLDATNAIMPLASVITSISLDHTEHLGDTIEKIAAEKAGIIKCKIPVFTGRMSAKAEEVFRRKAEDDGCALYQAADFTEVIDSGVRIDLGKKRFTIYSTHLRGEHQFFNAALAVKTLSETLNLNNGISISAGIRDVLANSGLEGRYEIINQNPMIIFDSAHNPEGVSSFINEFSKEYASYKERILIFGAMRDKSIGEMLEILKPYFTGIYFTAINIERAARPDELQLIAARSGIAAEIASDPIELISGFIKGDSGRCLVVLGSMYLLGEIKSKMFVKRLDKVI